MKTRYYSGTDGRITVFRATQSGRNYASVTTSAPRGWQHISFSTATPSADRYPVFEITKSEYEALQARRNTWLQAIGEDPANWTSPQRSYVPNQFLKG